MNCYEWIRAIFPPGALSVRCVPSIWNTRQILAWVSGVQVYLQFHRRVEAGCRFSCVLNRRNQPSVMVTSYQVNSLLTQLSCCLVTHLLSCVFLNSLHWFLKHWLGSAVVFSTQLWMLVGKICHFFLWNISLKLTLCISSPPPFPTCSAWSLSCWCCLHLGPGMSLNPREKESLCVLQLSHLWR